MADIAFLLLIFFLVTTQMNSEKGLLSLLPPMIEDDQPPDEIHDRNVFIVLVNANDQLMVEGEPMDISDLRAEATDFVTPNPGNDSYPEIRKDTMVNVPGVGQRRIYLTKQVISLQNDNGTSYNMYIQVRNDLIGAYNDKRNELSKEWFGKPFSSLKKNENKTEIELIKMAYPQRISEAEPKQVGGDDGDGAAAPLSQ